MARRKKIREIMSDSSLSQAEKSKIIQSLMDGRRRSCSSGTRSVGSSDEDDDEDGGDDASGVYANRMLSAAAAAALYYASDEEGDAIMSSSNDPRPDNISYGYNYYDDQRSVASEITHTSFYSQGSPAAINTLTNFPPGGTYRQVHGRSLSLQDWSDNDRAMAVASAKDTGIFSNNVEQLSRLMEQSRPPCQHYERNCTIISPCCGLAFACRICHDECPALPPPLNMRKQDAFLGTGRKSKATERRRSMPVDLMTNDEENHHPIDRFKIAEVICRECYLRQSSKTYVFHKVDNNLPDE